jgi:hypothetical protein
MLTHSFRTFVSDWLASTYDIRGELFDLPGEFDLNLEVRQQRNVMY